MIKTIYTIDVEGHDGRNPFDTLVWGNFGKETGQGIDKIMDLADELNVKGLFFVDFAAAWDYGKDTVEKVVLHILNRGHDVGVHVHPDHYSLSNRRFLWEYSYDEQFEIISSCTQLYKEITGTMPKSFRAGRYSANNDTLDILCKIGYKYDFSEFFGQKWCKIDPPISIITPVKYNSIIEIPVTSFYSLKLGKYKRTDRLDAALSQLFFKKIIKKARHIDNLIITMFSHSFSFIDWRGHPDNAKNDDRSYTITKNNMLFLKNSEYVEFISEADLDSYQYAERSSFEVIDCSDNLIWSGLYALKTAFMIRHANRKARVIISCLELLILVLVIATVLLFMY